VDGPPYYSAIRLADIAEAHWDIIDGEASSRGVCLFSLNIQQFLNAIYYWAIQRVKDPQRWKMDLETPPRPPKPAKGAGVVVTAQELNEAEQSMLSFAAAMGIAPKVTRARKSDGGHKEDDPVPSQVEPG
jgi:hypothetical protein